MVKPSVLLIFLQNGCETFGLTNILKIQKLREAPQLIARGSIGCENIGFICFSRPQKVLLVHGLVLIG